MGKILDEPKYTVVNSSPDFWTVVNNFSLGDYRGWALATLAAVPVGILAGASKSPAFARISGNMLKSSLGVTTSIGGFAGFLYAYQNSAGRLMGFLPSEKEQ
ncbi:hypothetical protein QBZ16_002850 [Prototheca wickerhamii]|uniref:NADH-ubiquinone oxidoreductase 21kDa subunit N-terminal domain-containing protein n=1 Tax=Prototheca wickerhamii TaxID=3111 RepID=A0AAD9III3_PROWI|nr:hypothetical protein QBZ16_002850 [Prototheca wickerhamii]